MPETPWGPDVAPHPLDAFAAPPPAGTWTLNDGTPVTLAQTFAAAPGAWTPTYGGGPVTLLFDNWNAAPVSTPLMTLLRVG